MGRDISEFIGMADACALKGMAKTNILRALKNGKIEGVKFSKAWLIHKESLIAYVKRNYPEICKPRQKKQAIPNISNIS